MSSWFDASKIDLKWDIRSENDEGDYDSYTTSIILYDGKEIWKYSTSSHSNIGGAWGNEHTAELSEEKCTVEVIEMKVGGDVSSGRTTNKSSVKTIDLVKLAEKAGCK